MDASIIQAKYDVMDAVAARFGQHAELSADLDSRVRQSFQALEHGGWMGRGATAFIAEMYGELLPAMSRLHHVLDEARAVTLQVKEIIQRAEQEAAALFGGGTSGGTTHSITEDGGKKPILIVINGVTDETGVKANYTKEDWQAFLKGKGLADKDVIFAPAVYNNENTPKFLDYHKFFGKDRSDMSAIKDEMNKHGDFKGSYTNRIEDALGKKLAEQDRPVIIVAHSGGGGIAPDLASRFTKSGIKVEGVVTLGSPFVDWKAAPHDTKTVAIRDTHDVVGNPDKRIEFGYGGQWKGKPDTSYMVDGGYSYSKFRGAHGSYFKSEQTWKLLIQEFPDLAPAR